MKKKPNGNTDLLDELLAVVVVPLLGLDDIVERVQSSGRLACRMVKNIFELSNLSQIVEVTSVDQYRTRS